MYRDDKKLKLRVAADNFASCAASDSRECERRIALLDELAYEICSKFDFSSGIFPVAAASDVAEDVANILDEEQKNSFKNILPENIPWINSNLKANSYFARAYLASAIFELAQSFAGHSVAVPSFYTPGMPVCSENRFAYVHNPYSDVAYNSFSRLTRKPLVRYSENFRTVAEAVSLGECRFCILPLGNSGEERISGFYSLIDYFDLRICASLRVEHKDSEESTRFGLLAASEPKLEIPDDNSRQIEIKLVSDDNVTPDALLVAADAYNLRLAACDISSADRGTVGYFTFTGDVKACTALAFYLGLFSPASRVLGIYNEINNTEVK